MNLDPELRRVLDGTPISHVATLLPDGAPHSVPVWIGTREETVVIMTGPGSRKARNLRRDPRIAISITPPAAPMSRSSSVAASPSGSTATRAGTSSTSSRASTSARRTDGTTSASSA
jgi:hypothetical protein